LFFYYHDLDFPILQRNPKRCIGICGFI